MAQKILIGLVLFVTAASGCKTREDDPIAGKGGNASLKIYTMHHSQRIDSGKVYIKYNAGSTPSNALINDKVNAAAFDDSLQLVKTVDTGFATFPQLKKGNYFIFGYGYDPAIAESVYGGVPFTITDEQAYKILCPVTEDH